MFNGADVGLRPLAYWDCAFESRRRHGCLSFVKVFFCQVEVSATVRSLIQKSHTECVCVCHWVWSGATVTPLHLQLLGRRGQTKRKKERVKPYRPGYKIKGYNQLNSPTACSRRMRGLDKGLRGSQNIIDTVLVKKNNPASIPHPAQPHSRHLLLLSDLFSL
jgi:hypothetical protein